MRKRKVITSNLEQKRRQVTKSSRTLNLGGRRSEYHFVKNPKPRAKEERNIKVLNYFESRAKKNSNCKFIKNPKPRAEEDKSIFLREPFRASSGRRTKPFPKPHAKEERDITLKIS